MFILFRVNKNPEVNWWLKAIGHPSNATKKQLQKWYTKARRGLKGINPLVGVGAISEVLTPVLLVAGVKQENKLYQGAAVVSGLSGAIELIGGGAYILNLLEEAKSSNQIAQQKLKALPGPTQNPPQPNPPTPPSSPSVKKVIIKKTIHHHHYPKRRKAEEPTNGEKPALDNHNQSTGQIDLNTDRNNSFTIHSSTGTNYEFPVIVSNVPTGEVAINNPAIEFSSQSLGTNTPVNRERKIDVIKGQTDVHDADIPIHTVLPKIESILEAYKNNPEEIENKKAFIELSNIGVETSETDLIECLRHNTSHEIKLWALTSLLNKDNFEEIAPTILKAWKNYAEFEIGETLRELYLPKEVQDDFTRALIIIVKNKDKIPGRIELMMDIFKK